MGDQQIDDPAPADRNRRYCTRECELCRARSSWDEADPVRKTRAQDQSAVARRVGVDEVVLLVPRQIDGYERAPVDEAVVRREQVGDVDCKYAAFGSKARQLQRDAVLADQGIDQFERTVSVVVHPERDPAPIERGRQRGTANECCAVPTEDFKTEPAVL